MEDITDADYALAKIIFNDFELKNLGDYHNVYVPSDTLLWADVFGNLRNMWAEIYDLELAKLLSAPGLAWWATLKNEKSKIRFFNWYHYVINGRKSYKRRNMSLYLLKWKS